MKKQHFPLHTFLFSLYPVLAMYAANLDQVELGTVIRPILISLFSAVLLLLIARLILKDWQKAGLWVSLILVLFFSYGHFYNLTEGYVLIGRHRTLILFWMVFLLMGTWWVIKGLKLPGRGTILANLIAVVVLIVPIYSIIAFQVETTTQSAQAVGNADSKPVQADFEIEKLPDIYYIILDAYARQDVLQAVYGYDNSVMRNFLTEQGFFIADLSTANYGQTILSLVSSLNLDYLETFAGPLDPNKDGSYPLFPFMINNEVRRTLESLGYSMVAFESGYEGTEIKDAYQYLTPGQDEIIKRNNVVHFLSERGKVNSFEVLLVQSSAGVVLTDLATQCVAQEVTEKGLKSIVVEKEAFSWNALVTDRCYLLRRLRAGLAYPFKEHRERIAYTLEGLPDIPETGGPRFVFAHIIAPHYPYVFGPDGEVGEYLVETGLPFWHFTGNQDTYKAGYIDQITYIDKRIQEVVSEILAGSNPVIIIQADHGPDVTLMMGENAPLAFYQERFAILNAYHLPESCLQDQLYPTITPVNTFRAIFNACLGFDFKLLEDRNFWSAYDMPFVFEDVTDQFE